MPLIAFHIHFAVNVHAVCLCANFPCAFYLLFSNQNWFQWENISVLGKDNFGAILWAATSTKLISAPMSQLNTWNICTHVVIALKISLSLCC
jgi:hypothetical protein